MADNTGFDKTPVPAPDYDVSKVPEPIRRRSNWTRTKFTGDDVLESVAQIGEIAGLYAGEAKQIAQQTEQRQNAVEEFNNQVIQDMTDKDVISAPEIIQARGGKSNLKARLDETNTQLNQIAIDAKFFGAIGDGVTDDTNALLSAFIFLRQQGGGRLILDGEFFVRPNELDIDFDVEIIGGKLLTRLHDLDGHSSIYVLQAKNTRYFKLNGTEIDQLEDTFSANFSLVNKTYTYAVNLENVVDVDLDRAIIKSWAVNPVNAHNTNDIERYKFKSKRGKYVFKRANSLWYDATFMFCSYTVVDIDESNEFTSISNNYSPAPNSAIETPSIKSNVSNNFIDGYINGMICGSSPLKHKYPIAAHESLIVEKNTIKNVRYGVLVYTGVGNNTRPVHFNSGRIKYNDITLNSDSASKYNVSPNERHAIKGVGTYHEINDTSDIKSLDVSDNNIRHISSFPISSVPQAILDQQAGVSLLGGFKVTLASIKRNIVDNCYNGVIIDNAIHTHSDITVGGNDIIDSIVPYVFGKVTRLFLGENKIMVRNRMYTRLFHAKNGFTKAKLTKPEISGASYLSYRFKVDTISELSNLEHDIKELRLIGKTNLSQTYYETDRYAENTFFKDDVLVRLSSDQVVLTKKFDTTVSGKSSAKLRDVIYISSEQAQLSAIGSLIVGDVVVINGGWVQITAIEGNYIFASQPIPPFSGTLKLGIPNEYVSPV